MIINNARGNHVSPGIYSKEQDVTYSVKSLGITSLGLAGETVKGPAFEPIKVEKWSEYEDYFGPTSAEKYKGNGLPKYELPYIAKEYLKESKQLYVCRVLGLSGYEAGKAWVVRATVSNNTSNTALNGTYAVAVLRSKGKFGKSQGGGCATPSGDAYNEYVAGVEVSEYKEVIYDGNCNVIKATTAETSGTTITSENLGKFTLKVSVSASTATSEYSVSLNYGDKDYIYNVLGGDPLGGNGLLYVEEVYDYAIRDMIEKLDSGASFTIKVEKLTAEAKLNDYKSAYKCAVTPWLVSQADSKVTGTTSSTASVLALFRAYTLSDGDNANSEVKISIQNIKPNEKTFDLVVRPMGDSDSSPVILEKFSGCNLVKGSKNYVALRIGTIDGAYELKSKYIALEMNEDEALIADSVPCGFLGYPLHKFTDGTKNFPVCYNTTFDYNVKAKRQYFGFSSRVGVDVDVLKFKGDVAGTEMSNGFHLDSIMNLCGGKTATVLGVSGISTCVFTAVDGTTGIADKTNKIPRILSEEYMKDTLYADTNIRKFTVCFYGGFDGWDVRRKERTNTDEFKANKYTGTAYTQIEGDIEANLDLPINAINSDYYAFLGAYRQFANPEGYDINIFATPGIDWDRNELLVEDALDMIEDSDDGRGGDALYIPTAPNSETADEVVDKLENTSINSSYASTYWPWIKFFDASENIYIDLPVTKDVVRNLAYTDNTAYPWFAPAGINRGNVNCVRACLKTKLDDEDTVYAAGINPVKTFAVDGVKIWGNKTMYNVDSPLNRVNVRRLMIRVKKLISSSAKQLIFDQYDDTLKNQFMSIVDPILANVKANRGIYDYQIIVDDSVEARDAHTLPCTIKIKPTPTLEYIDLTFTIYPESVSFDQ